MSLAETLARERRLRLAAERKLEYKQRELFAATEKLALQARALTDQAAEERRAQAAEDGGEARYLAELDRAHTAAVMAERRLWDSIETFHDGFAVFDSALRLVLANRAYLSVFDGYPQVAPGIAYEDILRLCWDETLIETTEPREAWVGAMLARWDREVVEPAVLRLSAGRWLRLAERRARDGDMVVLALDITETIEHEAALREAQERAEAANRAKSAFLANMSHEIRTPMNGVVGMCDLLCDTELSEEQRLFAETIRTSGEALLSIINDVLDYSKIEADKLVLRPEPFDLERSIHEVMLLLRPGAEEKGLAMSLDYDIVLPTRFIGDPGRIRQVLTNLIGNAVKFTERGGIAVRVLGFEAGPGWQELHVTVEDTGIGIAAEHLSHIFGEFNQIEDQPDRKFEGTGLGLAITRRLIGMMGGRVRVDSEPGEGSCFGFELVLAVDEDDAEDGIGQDPIHLRHALLAGAAFAERRLLECQIRACGLEVTECRSAEEAVALAGRGTHDLIVIEHDPAGIDGPALARDLRNGGERAPILLVAEAPGAPGATTRAGAEISDVLARPVLRRALIRALQALSGAAGEVPEAAPPSHDAEPLRRMRVLAAEDNRTNQLVFGKMVKDLDIELVFAGNGREAVELWRSFRPDLIFMDISMPEMDGRQAAAAIRAAEAEAGRGAHVPIVALTAHAMEGDAEDVLAAGIDHYMTKPLRRSAITERIGAFCPAGARAPLGQVEAA